VPNSDNGRISADQLTLVEQASLASGATLWETKPVERVGLRAIRFSDGPHGVRRQGSRDEYVGSGRSEPATCFPPAVALGSSWDPALLQRMGVALGREARHLNVQVLLGPGINIKRSPLCGRNFEYLSEDPHLSGRLGAALIDGVQSQGVGTSLKHFAVNNQETDRQRVSADVDERTLREIYLAAFEYAVTQAQPWTVMSSYNRINGTYSAENRWLLTEILREEWGFEGLVVSDWGGVDNRVAALRAGLDIEMPTMGGSTDALLLRAVEEGNLAPELLEAMAERVLALIERAAAAPAVSAPDLAAHHQLAREIAGQCAVLLKNDGVLPLAGDASVAVVGELACTPRIQGAGSSQVTPAFLDSPLDEMRAVSGQEIPFAAGYSLDGGPPDPELEAAAVSLARAAEITVVFLGLPAPEESEGYDRTHIDLPANQLSLLAAVAATGTRVVVVLANGGLVKLSDWDHQAHAILESWLLGQAVGGAIADLLFGVVNPSGKLAETIPIRLEDTPSYLNFPGEQAHVRYGEGVFVGYRHHDAVGGAVSYPFGHGLSYTTFDYQDLGLTVRGRGETLAVAVTARLTNTGTRSGREVVQAYVSAPSRAVRRPPRELRGFRKVELAPGESTTVELVLPWRDFAYYDVALHRWSVDSGAVTIALGASSRDLRLTGQVTVVGTEVAPKITVDSTLAEWAAHPAGRNVLEREMQPPADSGESAARFLSEASLKTVGSFPLSRLARFPGAHLDAARLEEFAEEVNAS
jgi:beta-glucosidase